MATNSKGSGYRYFAFRRGVTEPLVSEFYWKGIDGTSILSHWMPLGYRAGLDLSLLHETFEQLRRQSSTRHVLMPSGSGSTPPQPELCDTINEYNESAKSIVENPLMKVSTPSEFFESLEQEIEEKNIHMSIKKGEMYSEKHHLYSPIAHQQEHGSNRDLKNLKPSYSCLKDGIPYFI